MELMLPYARTACFRNGTISEEMFPIGGPTLNPRSDPATMARVPMPSALTFELLGKCSVRIFC